MMRKFALAVSITLCAVAVLGFARSAAAGKQVPFKGTLDGSFTATPIDPEFPLIVDVQLDAVGQATHLGEFTYDFPHIVDRSVRPSTGIGSCTFTAANGDQVFADIEGEATLIEQGVLSVQEQGTITGGTGRFKNATGSFVVERLIDQATQTTTGSFQGTISNGRSGKK
jgi:hypothetical protein